MIKQLLISLSLVCSIASHAAGIYKWVDDQGNTQYSATPPTESKTYQDLRGTLVVPRVNETNAGSAASENESLQEASMAAEQGSDQAALDREALWERNCQLAQKNVETLQGEQDVVRTDKDGNKVLLDVAQRQKALGQARKDVEYFCNP